MTRALTALLLAFGLLPGVAAAQFPTLESVLPRGGQRGTEVALDLRGKSLAGALDLMFSDPALELVELQQESGGHVRARVRIDGAAAPGPRWLRVRSTTGLSNLLNFSVGAFPHADEVEPNGTPEVAQALGLDAAGLDAGGAVTLRGVADSEDMDVYRFEGRAGQRVSVEVEAMRIGTRLDAAVSLVDERGFVLRSCDDVAFARQDPAFTVELPADGAYFVRVRQAAYRGSRDSHYLLHVGAFPRPLTMLPLGGPAGQPLEVQLLGDAGELGATTVEVPDRGVHGGWVPAGAGAVTIETEEGVSPTPCWLRVSALPNHLEAEGDGPSELTVPGAMNGRLEVPGDRDRFAFEVVEGKSYFVDVWARRLRSPLDSVIHLRRDPAGAPVKSNDDAEGRPDSFMTFTAKGSGRVELEILDQLRRGGPEFTYRVEVTHGEPSLAVTSLRNVKTAVVPRGGRTVALVRVERERAPGDLSMELEGLPEGVTATEIELPPSMGLRPVLLEAAADAPLAHAEVGVRIVGDGFEGSFGDERRLVEGANQTLFWAQSLAGLSVAVAEAPPAELTLEVPAVPMPRRGALDVRVRVARAEGVEGPVVVALPFLPPGVTSTRQVTIAADADTATLTLNTADDARLGSWTLVAQGEVAVPGSRVRVVSAPATLTVTPPFVRGKAQALSLIRAEAGQLLVEATRTEGCPEGGRLEAVGLPRGVSATPVPIGAVPVGEGAGDLLVPITSSDDTPTGKHSGLVVRAVFDLPGGRVVQSVAGAELRVKNAPPPEKAVAKPVPASAPTPKPAERPPTRLQKLRAEHARKVGAEGEGER